MGVSIIKINKTKKCQRCKKEIPENTAVLGVFIGITREIICQECVEILWRTVKVRNKLNKKEVEKR